MIRYAARRATPDLVAMRPIRSAANKNQAVSLANPLKARLKFATPSAQNRKQPIRPASVKSIAWVIQARIMNVVIATACLLVGSRPIGAVQTAIGTRTQSTLPMLTTREA